MSNSISGTASTPSVAFDLRVYGGDPREQERTIARHREGVADQHRARIRKARHETELEAAEYAQILQRKLLERALDPKTDPKLATEIQFKLLERGIGRVRDAESDDPKAKTADAQGMLELLAAMSLQNAASELVGNAARRNERDITPDDDTTQFLRDLESGD